MSIWSGEVGGECEGGAFLGRAAHPSGQGERITEVKTIDISTIGQKVVEVSGIINEGGTVDVPDVVSPIGNNPRGADLPA